MKRIIAIMLVAVLAITLLAGCKSKDDKESSKDAHTLLQLMQPKEGSDIAVMRTSMGTIKIMLFSDSAPKAVENFMKHAKEGYYNGLTFHKIINEFMVQTGDPKGDGTGGESIWGTPFEDEFTFDLWNFRGALTMANNGPDTNGSQFMIIQAKEVPEEMLSQMKDNVFPEDVVAQYEKKGGAPWLDHKNTVFGQVIEGMDIVDKIAQVKVEQETDGEKPQYTPLETVIIETITFEKAPAPTGEYLEDEAQSEPSSEKEASASGSSAA